MVGLKDKASDGEENFRCNRVNHLESENWTKKKNTVFYSLRDLRDLICAPVNDSSA